MRAMKAARAGADNHPNIQAVQAGSGHHPMPVMNLLYYPVPTEERRDRWLTAILAIGMVMVKPFSEFRNLSRRRRVRCPD
jgi:hypothetical protein